jgi:hypothetical protein
MRTAFFYINQALRFLLELYMLAAFIFWGFATGQTTLMRWMLGLGVPATAAVVWGMFISPKAPIRLSFPLRLGIEMLIFALAVAALIFAGQPVLAASLGLLYLVNKTILLALER